MITILLEQIIQLLTGWIEKFNNHAEAVENSLDTLNATTADIETNTDPIPEIRDNTGAVITPINNIKTNTDTIATNTTTTASNTTVIKNNIGTIATNTGSAAAFAEDCANNTLDIKDKVTTIASDTTQIRADHVELENDLDKIYNAIKWSCLDIETTETESGASPLSFNTDKAAALQKLIVNIIYTLTGSGDKSPSNPYVFNGYSNINITVNGNQFTISLGSTYYNGYFVEDENGDRKAIIDMVLDTITSTYLSGLSSSYIGYVNNVPKVDNHPCIWIRNWKYPPNAKGLVFGGINAACNMFNISMNNADIISTQYRLYFDVYNMNITTTADFITAIQTAEGNGNSLIVCYELETPLEITLTAGTINSIVGDNIISSDTNGDIEVTYKESVKHYLDKHDA